MRLLRLTVILLALHVTLALAFTLPFLRMQEAGDVPEKRKELTPSQVRLKKFKHGYHTSAGPMVHLDNIPTYGYFGGGYFAY